MRSETALKGCCREVSAAVNDIPELSLLPAFDLRELILSRRVSPGEAAAACLARVHALDPRIRAFVTIDEAMAAAMADEVERRLSHGASLPLAGVPYALKDLTETAGLRTTYGS
jgi:Asp-tRNA(Asn)/Glu-tRNA(Gln) amidotransferase A subunit family amidase